MKKMFAIQVYDLQDASYIYEDIFKTEEEARATIDKLAKEEIENRNDEWDFQGNGLTYDSINKIIYSPSGTIVVEYIIYPVNVPE